MRIEGLPASRFPWSVRPVLFGIRRMLGRLPTPYTVLARRPRLLWGFVLLTGAIETATLIDNRLKRLVSLRVAQMIGCPF